MTVENSEDGSMARSVPSEIPDRILWQRSRVVEASEDEAARFLDLAAFADGRLDPDEQARVAEWLARHPEAAEDIVAARMLAGAARHDPPEAVVVRARALVARRPADDAAVVAFRPRPRLLGLRGVAQWGSLAAALVIAGWLGFTLGMDMSGAFEQSARAADDGMLQDLLGPPPGAMRDLIGGA